ncbi:MAG: alanine racemase [Polyangiaceae bacterium]|nr:alanine racemase [Polyangiaceae bacterium]
MEHEEEAIRVLKPRRAAPADAVRPTRAEINLGALRQNLRVLKRALASSPAAESSPAIWGVLKADAYGHGAPAIARTLERAGVDGICVALLEEGLELRAAGIEVPVVVMGGYYGPHHRGLEDAIEGDLVPVLYEAGQLERLSHIARDRDRRVPFQLKVDTNMSRLGCSLSEVDELLESIASTPELELRGLMSHLACADSADPAPTLAQLRLFEDVRARAASRGLSPSVCHVANSAGALAFPASRYQAVRPGIALYGISPFYGRSTDGLSEEIARISSELRPAMRVRSEIVALRTLKDGDRVGYGHTWTASGERRIATIPMGYADGLSRALSNRGSFLVRGRRAPIAGIVSMDLTTIDVTDVPGVRLGDEVVVLGSQSSGQESAVITAEEIAEIVGTIPWEVITNISRRVPRFYREP